METVFPFGFPWPTAMYLALFVLAAAIYIFFMQYVLAGSIVLLVGCGAALARRRADTVPARPVRAGLLQEVVRDWLPAVFGLAIATAIAPLVFLQILYRREFYTASQLLFTRFLLLLPIMIAACLLLCLLKSEALATRGLLVRALVSVAVFACLLFAAWAWTGNHVLGLHKLSWEYQSKSNRWVYGDAEIWPRLGYWITASFPTLAVALAWQFHWGRRNHAPADLDHASRRLKSLALLGLAMSAAEASLWQLWLEDSARGTVLSMLALPYAILAFAGMGIQAAAWLTVERGTDLSTRRLSFISTGAAMTIVGAVVVREARRLAAVDVSQLFDMHRQAARAGGMGLFLVMFVLNAAIITTCLLIVRRALRALH